MTFTLIISLHGRLISQFRFTILMNFVIYIAVIALYINDPRKVLWTTFVIVGQSIIFFAKFLCTLITFSILHTFVLLLKAKAILVEVKYRRRNLWENAEEKVIEAEGQTCKYQIGLNLLAMLRVTETMVDPFLVFVLASNLLGACIVFNPTGLLSAYFSCIVVSSDSRADDD